MKKILLSLLALLLLFPAITLADGENQEVIDEKLGVPIVVYGANLTAEQKASVQKALNVSESSTVEEITVTGEDLATYIKDGNSSARMFSSAKITRTDAGKGLVISIVTPDNITQVTNESRSCFLGRSDPFSVPSSLTSIIRTFTSSPSRGSA